MNMGPLHPALVVFGVWTGVAFIGAIVDAVVRSNLRRRDRKHADAVLSGITPGDTHSLLQVFWSEAPTLRRRHRMRGIAGEVIGQSCRIACYSVILAYLRHSNGPLFLCLGALLVCLLAVITVLFLLPSSPLDSRVVEILGKYDTREVLAPLVELMATGDRTLRSTAMAAMTPHLLRLQASDGDLLTPGQKEVLYRTLSLKNTGKEEDFQLALLKALEQIGDSATLPYVQRLCIAEPWNPVEKRIKRAARECLPYLEAHAEEEQRGGTLLRPSQSPSS